MIQKRLDVSELYETLLFDKDVSEAKNNNSALFDLCWTHVLINEA